MNGVNESDIVTIIKELLLNRLTVAFNNKLTKYESLSHFYKLNR